MFVKTLSPLSESIVDSSRYDFLLTVGPLAGGVVGVHVSA